ncbi:MAG: PHB depolymerase family esterase [Bacteriovoracaceae bacterium]|nr:PHB depolymerase family esterase [Bacteriovoracaceae bacterium]
MNAMMKMFKVFMQSVQDSFKNQFKLEYKLFVPDAAGQGASYPLVVMLHGCDQTAEDFEKLTGMSEVAQREKFFVLYPKQKYSKNLIGCWNWFKQKNQKRGGFEPQMIVDLVEQIKKEQPINADKIFVAGISAGGAMAGMLASFYPEIFKASGIHSSVSFKRADGMKKGMLLMKKGPEGFDINPDFLDKTAGPVYVIHGGIDRIVHPDNAGVILRDLPMEQGTSTVKIVENMGHAWSGGHPGMDYSYPSGENASELFWAFFKLM